MNNFRKMGALLGAGAVIFSLAGCGDKNGNGRAEVPMDPGNVGGAVKDNLGDTANAVKSGAGAVANTVSGAVGATENAASGAGRKVEENLGNTANAVESGVGKMGTAVKDAGQAAVMTPTVKSALDVNPGLKGVDINVDTLGAKDSIALRGNVKSAAQKTLAAKVAQSKAPGYKIINQLVVSK